MSVLMLWQHEMVLFLSWKPAMDDSTRKLDQEQAAKIEKERVAQEMPFVMPEPARAGAKGPEVRLGSGLITAILGKGGMANVYEIWNSQLEVYRAVKLIHPTSNEDAKRRFHTEIKITAKLHHPNITEVHGVGKWNGLSYLEMERIEGTTLKNLIKTRGALPVTVCTSIGITIARALRYAHNQEYIIYGKKYQGIIHRDMKPSNIMLCNNGSVKLMDFGIARPTDASFHTMDGTVVGTLQYLSPEQLDGKELDVRTDIYSLATTMYEILTGVMAFPERNVSKVMADKVKNRYKPLSEYRLRIPDRLRRLIHRCMHHNPEKRIATADGLLRELQTMHDRLTRETPEQVIKNAIGTRSYDKIVIPTRRHFPTKRIAAAALAVALAVAGYKYQQQAAETRKTESLAREQARKDSLAALETTPSPDKAAPEQAGAKKREPRAAARTKPKVPKRQESLIERLQVEHGTNDLATIIEKEYRRGNYQAVLKVFDKLTPTRAAAPRIQVYKLRSLSKLGRSSALRTFLNSSNVTDSEFYLAKASQAYLRGDLSATTGYLDQALRSPRVLMDSDEVKREVYYYQALCATGVYDASPDETQYKKALGSWHALKAHMRSDPQHSYYRKAVTEMQRMGKEHLARRK